MTILWAAFLGILQGLTEFLPISSSGHLVLAQSLIPGFSQPGVLFDVVLHAGTLLAIIVFFWKKILKLNRQYLLVLVIASIPAALFGLLFQSNIEGLFGDVKIVGLALIITAIFNFGTDKAKVDKKISSYPSALFIGIAQALAIIPGISRSGATIFAGTKSGLERKKAAEFSFLLSVPAILGANVLQFASYGANSSFNLVVYMTGFLAALISGYVSISIVLKLLLSRRFRIFAVYCAVLGVLALTLF